MPGLRPRHGAVRRLPSRPDRNRPRGAGAVTHSTAPEPPVQARGSPAPDEAEEPCRDLLRIDTSNYGDGSGPGERAAAEHVMRLLTEVGLDPELFESEPGRASVVVRVEGDPAGTADRGALLV